MLAALAVSAVAWPVVAGLVTGVPTAFFDVQAAWGQRPDKGPFVLWFEWAWQGKGIAGVVVLVALAATYVALVLGRHGRWICIEARAWALAYPLYLFAVVRPITSMWRFLLLDFPLAALLASVAMRTANGQGVVPHWRRRVAVVLARPRRRAVLVDLLVARLHPVGLLPALTCAERVGADFSLSHRYGIMGPYTRQSGAGLHAARTPAAAEMKGFSHGGNEAEDGRRPARGHQGRSRHRAAHAPRGRRPARRRDDA